MLSMSIQGHGQTYVLAHAKCNCYQQSVGLKLKPSMSPENDRFTVFY